MLERKKKDFSVLGGVGRCKFFFFFNFLSFQGIVQLSDSGVNGREEGESAPG